MNKKIVDEFVSREPKEFRFKIGRYLASSLSGFVAGAIFASIVWIIAIYFYQLF